MAAVAPASAAAMSPSGKEKCVAANHAAGERQFGFAGLPDRDAAAVHAAHLAAPVPSVAFADVKNRVDFRCFTTRQPNSIAFNSASVGCRFVTIFKSDADVIFKSTLLSRNESAPTLRTSHGCAESGHFWIWSNRRFFFFCKIASASGENSGATMTSLKISAMASAHAPSSVWFTAMMPPNGACLSVANALSHASRRFAPWPTPHGFVCFKIAVSALPRENSAMSAAAAVRSKMLL